MEIYHLWRCINHIIRLVSSLNVVEIGLDSWLFHSLSEVFWFETLCWETLAKAVLDVGGDVDDEWNSFSTRRMVIHVDEDFFIQSNTHILEKSGDVLGSWKVEDSQIRYIISNILIGIEIGLSEEEDSATKLSIIIIVIIFIIVIIYYYYYYYYYLLPRSSKVILNIINILLIYHVI